MDAHERGIPGAVDYTGFLSWKFRYKAKMQGHDFLAFIKANPGHDVYFVNPFPDLLVWQNVWLQAEIWHPGLIGFTQNMFDRLGYNVRLEELENFSDTAAYCNYWVGNASFWDKYMSCCKPLYRHLLEELSPSEKELLWGPPSGQGLPCFPYIFERMFSTLLLEDNSIRACSYEYPEAQLRARFVSAVVDVILTNYMLGAADEGIERQRLKKDSRYNGGLCDVSGGGLSWPKVGLREGLPES